MQNTKNLEYPSPSFLFSISLAFLQETLQYNGSGIFVATMAKHY